MQATNAWNGTLELCLSPWAGSEPPPPKKKLGNGNGLDHSSLLLTMDTGIVFASEEVTPRYEYWSSH